MNDFTFAAVRTACRDILDALTDAGVEPSIEYLAGGCAAIAIELSNGSAILISDNDGRLPLTDTPRAPWLALCYPAWDGYPGEDEPATVHPLGDRPTDGDDTAAMLAAVTAYISAIGHTTATGKAATTAIATTR